MDESAQNSKQRSEVISSEVKRFFTNSSLYHNKVARFHLATSGGVPPEVVISSSRTLSLVPFVTPDEVCATAGGQGLIIKKNEEGGVLIGRSLPFDPRKYKVSARTVRVIPLSGKKCELTFEEVRDYLNAQRFGRVDTVWLTPRNESNPTVMHAVLRWVRDVDKLGDRLLVPTENPQYIVEPLIRRTGQRVQRTSSSHVNKTNG